MIEIPLWLLLAMAAAIVLLGTMLWNNLREREFHVRVPDLDSFEEALPSIAGTTKAVILDGNRAEILQNGDEFFPALLDSIARARETIHFETYVWWSGDKAFEEDLRSSVELEAKSWDRGYNFWHRTFDRACYMLSGQL